MLSKLNSKLSPKVNSKLSSKSTIKGLGKIPKIPKKAKTSTLVSQNSTTPIAINLASSSLVPNTIEKIKLAGAEMSRDLYKLGTTGCNPSAIKVINEHHAAQCYTTSYWDGINSMFSRMPEADINFFKSFLTMSSAQFKEEVKDEHTRINILIREIKKKLGIMFNENYASVLKHKRAEYERATTNGKVRITNTMQNLRLVICLQEYTTYSTNIVNKEKAERYNKLIENIFRSVIKRIDDRINCSFLRTATRDNHTGEGCDDDLLNAGKYFSLNGYTEGYKFSNDNGTKLLNWKSKTIRVEIISKDQFINSNFHNTIKCMVNVVYPLHVFMPLSITIPYRYFPYNYSVSPNRNYVHIRDLIRRVTFTYTNENTLTYYTATQKSQIIDAVSNYSHVKDLVFGN